MRSKRLCHDPQRACLQGIIPGDLVGDIFLCGCFVRLGSALPQIFFWIVSLPRTDVELQRK